MGVSRVDYGDETLIDISNDTVSADNLLAGATAHSADGEQITGNVITHNVIDNLTTESSEDALSAKQGVVLLNTIDNKISDAESNIVTEQYSNTKQYYQGDYCIYNGYMYKCKYDCKGNPPTNTTFWKIVNISNEIPVIFSRRREIPTGYIGSISAGGTKQVSVDVSEEGYTTLGCIGWYIGGSGTTNCYTKQAYVNGDGELSLYIKNTGSSAVTPNVIADILYIKNN